MPITVNTANQFSVQNYLTQPLGGNKFLISLSGVAFVELTGQQGSGWRREVVEMYVSLIEALRVTGRAPRQGYHLAFALQQWTSLVTPNAFTDLNQAVDFGVAVDQFGVDWQQGAPRTSIHVTINIAARDIDTVLHRIGYMLILIGDVVEVADIPIP
jgi:hypothetical protein